CSVVSIAGGYSTGISWWIARRSIPCRARTIRATTGPDRAGMNPPPPADILVVYRPAERSTGPVRCQLRPGRGTRARHQGEASLAPTCPACLYGSDGRREGLYVPVLVGQLPLG